MTEQPDYRFGPLERRGLIAGWRGGQIASVAVGLVVAVLAVRSGTRPLPLAVAVVAVLGSVGFACWPVAGRTGEEWLPTVLRWSSAGGCRRRLVRAPVAGEGHCVGPDGAPCLRRQAQPAAVPGIRDGARAATNGKPGPPSLRPPAEGDRPGGRGAGKTAPWLFGGLELLSTGGLPEEANAPVGVLYDARARTYTAVLSLEGYSFALLGSEEKQRRVRGWAGVLAALAREHSAVHRLQWVATTLPDDGSAVGRYAEERATLGAAVAARRSYDALLEVVGPSTCRHEVLLAAQVRADRGSARAIRAAGGGHRGACAVLLRELATLRRSAVEAEVVVDRTLGPRQLATVLRRAGHPGPPAVTSGTWRSCPPCLVGWPWPLAIESQWSCLRTDGTWHVTYWIAEWPRVDVGPDFLGPLLLGSVRRTVAVVMEPISPSDAVRQVEQARTADMADTELRRRGGFLATARRAREQEVVTRREEELADGHASFRFSGYVTVTAPGKDQLEAACEATEQAAGQCRLELRRLYGDQDRAFACTLPLARGLR